MTKPKVLVFGHSHHSNAGDDLFIPAFHKLFPHYELVFTDRIWAASLTNIDAVFIGGGSFLADKPAIDDDALPLLLQRKLFYLGVGTETDIHPLHQELTARALLIATRTPVDNDKSKGINNNVINIPDLVYALRGEAVSSPKLDNAVLILPNIYLVSRWNDPHWRAASWMNFSNQFSQFLDVLAERNLDLHFFAMSRHPQINDDGAASELINKMQHREKAHILPPIENNVRDITVLFSQYRCIITQRFHGMVLAEMVKSPYLAITHHDKMRYCHPANGLFSSYYEVSKDSLLSSFDQMQTITFPYLSLNSFALMQTQVNHLIKTQCDTSGQKTDA